ncbi:MAG TPA: ABC transporter substrate-binding protein [Stellaceae bacterium]|nr:ABC transporter substrate-binding protein [Stellaceae bacterium]
MRRRDLLALFGGAGLLPPLTARAQPAVALKRVGLLMSTAASGAYEQSAVAAFVQTLEKAGWASGRNVEIILRWGNGDAAHMRANAREVVALAPDVIMTKGANLPYVAELTPAIPIVFVLLSDANAVHYVTSLAHPGGNITGFTSGERDLVGKRLQLLREIDPGIERALYLRGERVVSDTKGLFQRLAADAAALRFPMTDGAVQRRAEVEPLIAGFARQARGGLIVAFDAFNATHTALIVGMAAKYRLPAIYFARFFTDAGGLISYGFDQDEQFREAAAYVDRILKGARPGELPVQQPTRFQLVINLKTAKAVGLTIPPSLLARADEVIE